MNINSFIIFIVLILCFNNLFSQDIENSNNISKYDCNNSDIVNNSYFHSGIYLLSSPYVQGFSCIETHNIYDSYVLERNFLFFKRKINANYKSRKYKIIDSSDFYKRSCLVTHDRRIEFYISPQPIINKSNIIRINDNVDKQSDSSKWRSGLMFKITNYKDSQINFSELNNNNCENRYLGLIINDKLVAVDQEYFYEEKLGNQKVCYLLFFFYENSDCIIEEVKRELFQQTLIKK